MPLVVDKIVTPKGNIIEPFDAAIEDVISQDSKFVRELTLRYFGKKGTVPIYSKKDNSMFIHSYKDGTSNFAKNKRRKRN